MDHPNQTKDMQEVIVGRALPAIQKGRIALHLAASNGQDEIVRYICAVPGINVNVQDKFGFTPLHLAAHSPDHGNQRVCVIKELLHVKNIISNSVMHGKFLDAADFQGSRITALHLAVRGKFKDAVDLLFGVQSRGTKQ
jgi:ankyrin repeat protein